MTPRNHTVDIEEYLSDLSPETATYKYVGFFDEETADRVIIEVDQLLQLGEYDTKIRKKVFHVTIELVQNLAKYLIGKGSSHAYSKAGFMLHGEKGRMVITSGNYILQSEMNSLKSRIKLINSLTNDELVHFYRGLLDVGNFSDEGGAGLGFVDIAKKAGSKIHYEFKEVNEEYAFYIFKILISN